MVTTDRQLLKSRSIFLAGILYAIPYSLLGLFTAIRGLEVSSFFFFDTVNRVTYANKFIVKITGSNQTDDILLVIFGMIVAVILFYRKSNPIMFAVTGYLAALFTAGYLLNQPIIEDVAALSALPVNSILYAYLKRKIKRESGTEDDFLEQKHQFRITKATLFLACVGLLGIIDIYSVITWLAYPANPSSIYKDETWWFGAHLEEKLFYAVGMASPVLITILTFSFGIKYGFDYLVTLAYRRKHKSIPASETTETSQPRLETDPATASEPEDDTMLKPTWWFTKDHGQEQKHYTISKKATFAILLGSCLLVILFTIYPYIPSINPNSQSLSVDSGFYVNQILALKTHGVHPVLLLEETSDRAFSVLIFYAVETALNQPTGDVVQFLPILGGLLTVFSVYFLMRYVAGRKSLVTLLAPLLTAFSFQFIVGFYGGLFSNMLAIPVALTAVLFYLRFLDSRRVRDFGLFFLLLTAVLVIHVYTWLFFAGALIISSIIFALTGRYDASRGQSIKRYAPVFGVIAFQIIALVSFALVLKGHSALDYLESLASSSVSPSNYADRWANLNFAFHVYMGGFMTNSVMILLALYWAITADRNKRFNVILLVCISLAAFPFFLGNTETQSRFLYMVPLQIPAAIVLSNIATGKTLGFLGNNSRMFVVAMILLHFADYGLRSLANFYLIQT